MRTLLPALLVLLVALLITSGFTSNIMRFEKLSDVPLKAKGLPEHGLVIVGPSDEGFDNLAAAYLTNITDTTINSLKPFSVFLRNSGDMSVIAYKLKWEVKRKNGTISILSNGRTNSRRILNTEDPSAGVIEPGSVLFCSMVGCFDVTVPKDQERSVSTAVLQAQTQDGEPHLESTNVNPLVSNARTELMQSSGISVSLDGALFSDGTFAGADTTNLFSWVNSVIDVNRDMFQEIRTAKPGYVKPHLEKLTGNPKVELNPKSTYTDFYEFNKQRLAHRLLKKVATFGEQSIRAEIIQSNKLKLSLRKVAPQTND